MSTAAMRPRGRAGATSLRTGMLLSAVIHGGVVAGVIMWGLQREAPRPPVYRVEMIAAPKGTRAAGVVNPPAAKTSTTAEAPSGAERAPTEKALPSKKAPAATAKATPSPVRSKAAGAKGAVKSPAAAAPAAGSREGGKGADVRNLKTAGIDFPYPGYLTNIVRQITLAYTPPRGASAALVAEVKFMIRRDGSVAGIELVKSSNNRLFDLEAQATVESVGATRSFGPLPSGWSDDVLVVYFTFDYALRP